MSDIHGSCNNKCPDEWERKTVDELSIRVGSGVTPRGGSEVYKDEGVIFVRSQNVKFEGLDLSDVAYIDDKTNDEMKGSEIFPFDVLLNITGASIGRCCFVPDGLGQANVNQHVCAIRLPHPTPDDAKFLSIVLSSSIGQSQILRLNAGGNREGLNYQQLRSFEVPWPTSYERTKIAKILTTVDNLIEKTEALIAKYQAIKQGMMRDLFTRGVDEHGHLRPPYDEAPELYKESELGWIPKEWETPPFDDITPADTPICYGIVQPGEYDERGVPVVAIYNLHSDFTELHRSSKVIEAKYVRSRVAAGDVLISVKGTIGRVDILPEWFEGNISRDIARIRPKPGISGEYLRQMLDSVLFQRHLGNAIVGTTRAELSIGVLRKLPIILPLPEEQELIARSLRASDSKLKSEKTNLEKLRYTKTGLMQDLLTGKVRMKIEEAAEAVA